MRFEREQSSPNEVFATDGKPLSLYAPILDEMERMGVEEWNRRTGRAHRQLLDTQRDLGITGQDKSHPTDYLPRVIPATDWAVIEKGLAQRMLAINEFLRRLEAGKQEIVPQEILESSTLYDPDSPDRLGSVPNRQMGFDLVAVERPAGGAEGWEYVVIEDNAKMPVGIEPMLLTRGVTGDVLPESYAALGVRPLDGLMRRFGEVIRASSPVPDPVLAIISAGPDDQYYLDHRVFASELDALLVERHEVELDHDGYLIHKGSERRIDIIYERIESGRIYDDLPGLVRAQAERKVRAVFAPSLGIADDKGVYPFIPEMIRTYLGEEPVIQNVETFSLAVEEERRYVMDNFGDLVVKSRSGWGGKDVMIGPEETQESVEEFRRQVEADPIEYIGQKVVDFSTHVLCEADGDDFVLRDSHADYRVHALAPDEQTVEVVPGAMTRVAAPGSRLVNVSSGGKIKDTWVLR